MNGKKLTLLVILLLILDQALKIWVKTHMTLGEAIILIPDWFQLYFIENKGAAFGMHIATPGTMDWGKLLLGLFRIGMVVALIWLIRHFMRKKAPKGVLIGFGLILAGAIGNIIDSAFYGLIFSASTPDTVAHFGGHYAGFMMGKVVDIPGCTSFATDCCMTVTRQRTLFRSALSPSGNIVLILMLPKPSVLTCSAL